MLTEINQKILKSVKPGGDKFEGKCLKLLKSELLNNQKTESPKEEIDIVKSYVKKLQKSIKSFENFPEKYQELEMEIKVVMKLLPPEVSEERIRDVVATVISNLIAAENPTLDELIKNYKGRIIGSTKKVLPDADPGLIAKVTIEEVRKAKND